MSFSFVQLSQSAVGCEIPVIASGWLRVPFGNRYWNLGCIQTAVAVEEILKRCNKCDQNTVQYLNSSKPSGLHKLRVNLTGSLRKDRDLTVSYRPVTAMSITMTGRNYVTFG